MELSEETLRDVFAAAALAGMCANSKLTTMADEDMAEAAYAQADAMLEERLVDPEDDEEDDEN